MFRFSFAAALALAASFMQPVRAADADEARLAAYRLDQATMTKVDIALGNMVEAVKKQPSLAKGVTEKSIAGIAAGYDSKPPLKQAIESAGLTSDSFTVFLMSWIRASIIQGLVQTMPADQRAAAMSKMGVSPANLAFVEANQVALKKMGEKFGALQPSKPAKK